MKPVMSSSTVHYKMGQPYHFTGYILYRDNDCPVKYNHLKPLIQFCIANGIDPIEAQIKKELQNPENDRKLQNLGINEYAYPSVVREKVSLFTVERLAWSWIPDTEDLYSNKEAEELANQKLLDPAQNESFIENSSVKNKSNFSYRLLCWITGLFSIFR